MENILTSLFSGVSFCIMKPHAALGTKKPSMVFDTMEGFRLFSKL